MDLDTRVAGCFSLRSSFRSHFLFFLAILSLLSLSSFAADPASRDQSPFIRSLRDSHPTFLEFASPCAANSIPHKETRIRFLGDKCLGSLDQCLRDCRDGDGAVCYSLALAVQTIDGSQNEIYGGFFRRSCELGVVSGCTNYAADLSNTDPDCAFRIFQKACAKQDPWACTMMGMFLIKGESVPRDLQRARVVLAGSCRYGDDDPACQGAKGLLAQIDQLEKQGKGPAPTATLPK